MKIRDGRKLKLSQKELVRKQAVDFVLNQGLTREKTAILLGVSGYSVRKWVKSYNLNGEKSLNNKKVGRPRSTIAKLKPYQCANIVRIITDNTPDQLKLPFMLWDRKSIQILIKDKFDVDLSIWSVGRYLKKWGFTPQRPLSRSFEKNPKAVTRFLQEEFPAIKKQAKEENGEIQFLDEMGLKNNIHHYIRGYSKKGQTPIIAKSGSRLSINMISTISNNGKMRFMTYEDRMDKDKFITFLRQLIKSNFSKYGNKKKIFLIADNLKVHKAYKVQDFVKRNKDKIEIFFLPAYSPELNPDELLNQDVKANALKHKTVRTKDNLKSYLKSYLFQLQKTPQKIRNFFKKECVRYAM